MNPFDDKPFSKMAARHHEEINALRELNAELVAAQRSIIRESIEVRELNAELLKIVKWMVWQMAGAQGLNEEESNMLAKGRAVLAKAEALK